MSSKHGVALTAAILAVSGVYAQEAKTGDKPTPKKTAAKETPAKTEAKATPKKAPKPRLIRSSADPTEQVRDHPKHVDARTVQAIDKGVAWLARRQSRDGGWREGRGMGASYPAAMTALAGMALLGHGNTPTRGRYAKTVKRAVQFLTHDRQVRQNGLITSGSGRSMYGHGFATMFLGCVLGESGDPLTERKLKRVLTKAIKLIGRSQSKLGGWYYTPESRMDEGSVTVTQVQALRACQNAGVAVPVSVIKQATKYIEISQNADGGISYSANRGRFRGGRSNPAISAAACAVLYNAGKYDSKMANKCLAYCRKTIRFDARGGFGHWFYTHLYLSQAYWQAGDADWDKYYPQIRDRLLKMQANDGSWQGDGVGMVYGTSLAITILTLPYERIPLYMR